MREMEETGKRGVIKKDALGTIATLLGIKPEVEEVEVYEYKHPTDGCICPGHVAISLAPEGKMFFGVPKKLVPWN